MRIVHLWKSPGARGGGGGLAMGKLHERLLELGHESAIICMDQDASGTHIHQVPRWRHVEGGLKCVTGALGLNDIHRVTSWLLPRHPVFRQADVVHIHGLHGGYLSYLALPSITAAKPTVFTLHDMWALTGHCMHYLDCTRWQTGCGQCPHLDTQPAVKRDATALEWRLKRRVYGRTQMAVVAVSRPQLGPARQGLLRNFPLRYIPNGVDTAVFRPRPQARQLLRKQLGIGSDQIVVMFASLRLSNPSKGLSYLLEALGGVEHTLRQRLTLLLAGGGSIPTLPEGLSVKSRGLVGEESLASTYAAADIFVLPTMAEAQGKVFLESMASETPPLAFASFGVTELVRHGETGLLVPTGDVAALRAGIVRLAGDPDMRARLGRRGSEIVKAEYSAEKMVERYLELYEEETHRRHRDEDKKRVEMN